MTTKFRTVLLDPPWSSAQGGGKINRGAQSKYDLIKPDKMAPVITGSGLFEFEENAHLYMWSTNNALKEALTLMEELNFRYITNLVWMKNQFGIGQYFRGQHELLLFGVRGKGLDPSVCTVDRSIPSACHVEHERENGKIVHSRKPECFYDMIEQRSNGPYLEMFARKERGGQWASWGNEI